MKKSFLFLPIIVLLASCALGTNDSSTSVDGSTSNSDSVDTSNPESIGSSSLPITSLDSVTSPSTSVSNNTSVGVSIGNSIDNSIGTSTGDSSTTTPVGTTIAEILQMTSSITPLTENKRHNIDYDAYAGPTVTFDAKYLAELTDNNHRLLQFADSTASIGVAMTYNTFSATGSKMNIGTCYRITGKVSIYLGRPEIIFTSYASSALDANINLSPIAPEKTIGEAHAMIADLEINNKGNAFSSLITIEAQYVAKADNAVMMFYDGAHIIQVHGDNYVNNGRTIGETWKLIVSIGRYQYKPSLEFISGVRTKSAETIEFNNPVPITSAELRAKKYKNEEDKIVGNLEVYPYIYSFSGYVSCYVKNNAEYLGLVDNLGDRADDNGTSQPNLSLRLKNHSNLYGNDANYSVFIPYFDYGVRVENVIFAIYMYNGDNTIKTWQIHSFDDTVTPLDIQ